MKKTLFTLLFLASLSTFSQFKITGYFDAEIGVNYAFSDKFQIELRASDDLKKEFGVDLSLLYKFVAKEDYNINLGIGITTFPFHSKFLPFYESVYLPLQIEIIPFKGIRNFGFVIESAYHFSDITDNSGIRNSVGIRYLFE